MSEQMKFIIKEINATLIRNYDLIKFDALNEKQLLQVLVDLLVTFNAGDKLNVEEDDPETVSVCLLEMLGNVKYRPPPGVEPATFRAQLLAGDARTIHHIIHWLLSNRDQVKNTAYLAKYLKLPDIPEDVVRNSIIQELLEQYQGLITEFKDVHKRTRLLEKENSSEIINDIKEMAVERDIVIKRLENVQVHLVDVRNKEELLEVSKRLRLQQQRAKELEHQYDVQQSQLNMLAEQLRRYLSVAHGAAPKTSGDVIKHLQDEIQLNTYLMKEKLPQELEGLQKELNIMQAIATEQHPSRSDITLIQDKIAAVNSEIEQLVQRRLAATNPAEDKLAPFRQQAAVIKRNKEASAARVDELAASLQSHEAALADLQSQVKQLLGDMVLRGEELKKYVNSLRAKSTLYKRQRANLSTFKSEAGVLTRTLQILTAADPTVEMALLNHKKMRIDDVVEKDKSSDLTKTSLHDLSQMVAQTAQKLSQVRQELQPLADRIKPVKIEFQETQQLYEQKKRVYEANSINISSQMEPLKKEVKELTEELNSLEEEWKQLRQKIAKAESLQEVVMAEMKNSMQSPRKPSRIEELKKQVADAEEEVKSLEEQQRAISSQQGAVEEQTRLWQNVVKLLECKMQAKQQPARQGQVHITQHSQMLTLT
ncbi:intraflagellar transport protein 81 homolog [Aricia agestis]|uniref:intraflagellar transport protein 81 homolog n=1 Tax=Aricia agestis TaxID=91739 RepID=UPI001C209EF9|nr:intraflagellar transport protein 81 homolog [Aricia agestis]